MTNLVYDEAGHLLGEYTSTGALIQETIWMGDTPVATLRPNGSAITVYYVETDQLNAPRVVVRTSDHSPMWRWDADPFGTAAPNQNPNGLGTFVYNLRFPGQYYQAETGLNYNHFRDYDPQTGQYLESDPIGLAGGQLSTYAYAGSNPISRVDPRGLTAFDYIECLMQQAHEKGNQNCNGRLVQSEINKGKDAVCTTVKCTAHCAFVEFVGADPIEFAKKAHEEVIEKALEKAAEQSESKLAKKLIPFYGQGEMVKDTLGTIRCSVTCVEKQAQSARGLSQ